jgi:hypothetical protein
MKQIVIAIVILFIGFQATVKCFNHFTPILSIVPMALTLLAIYLILKKSTNEKN